MRALTCNELGRIDTRTQDFLSYEFLMELYPIDLSFDRVHDQIIHSSVSLFRVFAQPLVQIIRDVFNSDGGHKG